MASSTSGKKNEEFILDPLTIICCPCYIVWWKEIYKNKSHEWKSTNIEKEKSIRKYFYAEKK